MDKPQLSIKSVDVTPTVAHPGDNVTSVTTGVSSTLIVLHSKLLDSTAAGGTLSVEVFLNGIKLITFSHDLCQIHRCPLKKEAYTATVVQNIPSFAFPGTYTVIL
jgi:hypothetical protein